MKLSSSILLIILAHLGVCPSIALGEWEDDRIQLRLASGVSIGEINDSYGTSTSDELDPLYLIHVDPIAYPQLLVELNADSRVVWAEPSYRDETPETVRQMVVAIVGGTIADYEDQNVYSRIGLQSIHEHVLGTGVTVAVIDTGVKSDHEALAGSVIGGPDYIDNDGNPDDSANGEDDDWDGDFDEGAGHGTMVAGIIHLTAPGATIMPIRALDDEGHGISFDVAKGIRYAVQNGAHVINMSFGLLSTCETIAHELAFAEAAGVLMIGAAGNDGSENPPYFPAIDPSVVSVAALDSSDVKASFSNFHSDVGTSAPGDGILAPFYDGSYALGAGTSFAAPFISGQAALILDGTHNLGKSDVESLILGGVVDIYQATRNYPYLGKLGTGRVDGYETWSAMQSAAAVEFNPGGWSVNVGPNPARSGEPVEISWARELTPTGRITIVDAQGRQVARLTPSSGLAYWDGRDERGHLVPQGIYFVRVPGLNDEVPGRIIRLD